MLGVRTDAGPDEVRAAYIALARRHHPDVATGSADRIRELNDAWAVLGDARRRRAYDLSVGVATIGDDLVDEDDVPVELLDDTPLRPPPRHNRLVVTPVVLFFASVACGIFGMMMASPVLFGLAFVMFLVAGVLMVVMPLFAMGRSRSSP